MIRLKLSEFEDGMLRDVAAATGIEPADWLRLRIRGDYTYAFGSKLPGEHPRSADLQEPVSPIVKATRAIRN